jgi:hypothetical protein
VRHQETVDLLTNQRLFNAMKRTSVPHKINEIHAFTAMLAVFFRPVFSTPGRENRPF